MVKHYHYQLKHEIITVDEIDYGIQSLKDRQQFDDHEQLAAELGICAGTWSLFGVLWPAAYVLANKVSQIELMGKRVLEIGCGIGLSSIVLHKLGIDITASDNHPLAKEFLDRNVKDNHMSPIKYQTGNWSVDNPLLGQFDVIIGSDILYQPDHIRLVSNFIDLHSEKMVDIIIVDPDRPQRNAFTSSMCALGFSHEFVPFNINEPSEQRCKGRILYYHRSKY